MKFDWLKIEEGQLLSKAISVLIILLGALILWSLLARAMYRARTRFEALLDLEPDSFEHQSQLAAAQRRVTALRLVFNTTKYALCAVVIFLVLEQVNVNLGSLLLPAGFLGAALGLGSQSLVRDMVAGLFIVFEGQFAVGDVVSINGVLGTVEEVGFRVTRVRDDAAQLHFFPNGTINTVARYPYRYVPLVIFVSLEDGAQRDRAESVVRAALERFDDKFNALTGDIEPLALEPKPEPDPTPKPKLNEAVKNEVVKDVKEETKVITEFEPSTSWLRLRVWVYPWRLQILRDKLPSFVNAALQKEEIKLEEGTEVEVLPSTV